MIRLFVVSGHDKSKGAEGSRAPAGSALVSFGCGEKIQVGLKLSQILFILLCHTSVIISIDNEYCSIHALDDSRNSKTLPLWLIIIPDKHV